MRPLVNQYAIRDASLKERLDVILPAVMEETGTESWIILCREYNEDPVFDFGTPCLYPTARRLTILLFFKRGEDFQRISVSRPDPALDRYYTRDYDVKNETQFAALARVLKGLDPKNIAINASDSENAFTDGLTHSLHQQLLAELPAELTDRFISADDLGIRFLETRTSVELSLYPEVMAVATEIIDRAFSNEAIIPGKTTCRDVMTLMEQEVNDRGITTWFPPTIDLQREGGMFGEDTVIQPGDLVHCDFGIVYLGVCTDTQRLCYILKEGESDAPKEIYEGLKRNNAFQDIVRKNMALGGTGNEVFERSVAEGKALGLRPFLYTHPCGLFGHSAGPTIGLWDHQKGDIPRGERKVFKDTSYALELSILEYLDCYKQDTFIFTEETVVLHDGVVSFLDDRRDKLTVLRAAS